MIVAAVPVLTGGCARQGKKSRLRRYRGRHARRGRHAWDGDARSQGVASVEVSTAPLPSWASPQSVAMAAWITVLLTLIGVILAAAAQEATSQAPAPVQIVIVPPSSTGLIPRSVSMQPGSVRVPTGLRQAVYPGMPRRDWLGTAVSLSVPASAYTDCCRVRPHDTLAAESRHDGWQRPPVGEDAVVLAPLTEDDPRAACLAGCAQRPTSAQTSIAAMFVRPDICTPVTRWSATLKLIQN